MTNDSSALIPAAPVNSPSTVPAELVETMVTVPSERENTPSVEIPFFPVAEVFTFNVPPLIVTFSLPLIPWPPVEVTLIVTPSWTAT